ncbi:MAG: putative hydrolases of HD superfamily [Desulfobacteraceae bacterium Eth-SRB1]|nr:MAG: putative hydrolases of HD superfamily [Desulfobacteraceae bacterium Eth-SRB1]
MKHIANLLFEAKMLKEVPRSGFHFLGLGKESVAEHSFITTFIGYVISNLETGVDALRLISMCLVHDLSEAKIGDLNYVHKQYVTPDTNKAVEDTTADLPFGRSLAGLMHEFNEDKTKEANLAHDADQLAFILELKQLIDTGYEPPKKWLQFVLKRLQTKTGEKLAKSIMKTDWDSWWLKNYVEKPNII